MMLANLSSLLLTLLQILLVLLAAPLLDWGIEVVARRLVRRTPLPFLQPWRDIIRQLRKQAVVCDRASLLHSLRPWLECLFCVSLLLLVPAFSTQTLLAPVGDLLILAGLWYAGQMVALMAVYETDSLPPNLLYPAIGVGWLWGAVGINLFGLGITQGSLLPAQMIENATGSFLPIWPMVNASSQGNLLIDFAIMFLTVMALVSCALAGSRSYSFSLPDGSSGPNQSWPNHSWLDQSGYGYWAMNQDYSGHHAALLLLAGMSRRVACVVLLFALLLPGSLHQPGEGLFVVLIAVLGLGLKLTVASFVLGGMRAYLTHPDLERRFAALSILCGILILLLAALIGGKG